MAAQCSHFRALVARALCSAAATATLVIASSSDASDAPPGAPIGSPAPDRVDRANDGARAPAPRVVLAQGEPQRRLQTVHPEILMPVKATVPKLIGAWETQVDEMLRRARLQRGATHPVKSTRPPGTVVRQKPEAETIVPVGTKVDVYVVENLVEVPRVVGARSDAARAILAKAGLGLSASPVASLEPAGVVISQSPLAEARVSRGTLITATVSDGSLTHVPALIGLRESVALERLRDTGLALGDRRETPSGREAGVVLSQTPKAPGVVRRGTPVSISVAKAALVPVPEVRGKRLEAARRMLDDAKLRVRNETPRAASAPGGEVIDQQPRAGTPVAQSAAVDLWVSDGSLVRVPELVGRTEAEAARLAREAGLAIGPRAQEHSADQVGRIVRQDPPFGREVARQSAVRVWVGVAPERRVDVPPPREDVAPGSRVGVPRRGAAAPEGPVAVPPRENVAPARTVEVPPLEGLALEAAREALARHGLKLGRQTTRADVASYGWVLAQQPAAGSPATVGAQVSVVLSDGSLTRVPALVGASEQEIEGQLRAADLRLGKRSEEPAPQPQGEVIRQSPAPQTTVRRGEPVDVWIAILATVTVPEVRGTPSAQAKAALERAGLSPLIGRTRPHADEEGTVLEQSPGTGTIAERGAVVTLELSAGPPTVPDLSGLRVEQAQASVEAVGLKLAPPAPGFFGAARGTVIEQTPAAGGRVPPGETVTVRMSSGPLAGPVAFSVLAALLATGLGVLGLKAMRSGASPEHGAGGAQVVPRISARLDPVDSRGGLTGPAEPGAPRVRLRVRLEPGDSRATAADRLIARHETRKP